MPVTLNPVVIAQMDTGLDDTLPWLQGSLWTNAAPTDTVFDGTADDFVETAHGLDFPSTASDPWHGSIVAGLLVGNGVPFTAARASAYGAAQLLFMNGAMVEGRATQRLEKAVDYLIAQKQAGANIRIFNASFGFDPIVPAMRQRALDALKKLEAADILVVAAAGETSQDTIGFPAGAGLSNVLSVGRPGGGAADVVVDDDVLMQRDDGSTVKVEGTSFAAPQVAAMAARLMFAQPGLSAADVKTRLIAELSALTP